MKFKQKMFLAQDTVKKSEVTFFSSKIKFQISNRCFEFQVVIIDRKMILEHSFISDHGYNSYFRISGIVQNLFHYINNEKSKKSKT